MVHICVHWYTSWEFREVNSSIQVHLSTYRHRHSTFPKVSFNLHIQIRIYFIFSRQLMDPCILITKFQNYLVRESYENSSVGQGVCLIIITMKFYYEKYQKKTKLYVIFKSKSSFRISK